MGLISLGLAYNRGMSIKFAISLMSLWLSAASPTAPLTGKVVAVHDGDTFTIQSGRTLYKIRLADVDAPEMAQVFGKQAHQFTAQIILGRKVRVDVVMIDRHGRRVGTVVTEDGRVLNEELVHAGLAWYYRVNPFKNRRLQRLEQEAFAGKLGLWVEKAPLPPWEFRRESHIPELPLNVHQVDYDRIFHYGLIGDFQTKTMRWPACKDYRLSRPPKAMVFHSLQQARQLGFQPAADCPK